MAYCFKLDEKPQTGLRRIAREQAARAIRRLAGDTGGEATIHESRKAFKRLRALFKLTRAGLGKSTYEREHGTIRDIARSLSGARDFEVMPNTLAAIAAQTPDIDAAAVASVQRAIAAEHAKHTQTTAREKLLHDAIGCLEAARERYRALKLANNDFELLAQGAGKGLKMLRQQHDRAVESCVDNDYHDWRKSAQLHWRQMRLLEQSWPEMIAARIKAAKALADVLGHDHDLAVLAAFVGKLPTSDLKKSGRRALLTRVCERQQELRTEARAYAGLLIADDPVGFVSKLSAYQSARSKITRLEAPLCTIGMETAD